MEQFFMEIWETIYFTTIDLFYFILYQAWLVLGLVILLAAAKIFDWRLKGKKGLGDKEQ